MDYPVLNNRPINKWKVAELKEELKRRNLPTRGLKDDLVMRLSESIREEMEAVEMEDKGSDNTDSANGPGDTQPDPNSAKFPDDVKEHNQSEVTKGFDHVSNFAGGPEDPQPDTIPVKLVDDVKEHHQNEASKGFDRDGDSACGLEDTQADIDSAKVVDDVQRHHLSGFDDVNIDVATENRLVEIDQNKVSDEGATGGAYDDAGEKLLEAPVNIMSVADELASAEIVSTDQSVEDKIDKEHEAMNFSQDKDVVIRVSGMQDFSIQGCSTGQDVADMKISSSDEVLGENLRKQENGVEVTPVASKKTLENDSIKLESKGLKLSGMDAESDMSDPTTQVHKVNPNLGSQVKSDSFSTDTLPINENKDLNDNLNADNVKLENEVVRQEMELQSSSKDLSDVGSSHPLDDQMPQEMQGLVGETNDDKSSDVKFSMKNDSADQVSVDVAKLEHVSENKASNNSEQTDVLFEEARTSADVVEPYLIPNKIEASGDDKHGIAPSNDRKDFSKITDVVDGDNMETINLDQSSADDSMEEDVLETKHLDIDQISKEERDKTEETITEIREEPKAGFSDVMQQDVPSDKIESPQETKDRFPDLSEKRKFQDEVGSGSKEPAKRLRRWNTENSKTAESQNSTIVLSKNLVQTTPVKPVLGRINSSAGEEAPKELFVPKSSKTATKSLKIENFLRPFTLKAVQELLARTGEVCSFWMDHIKTHCYVTYSSVEEAIETRNTVYNLQWPPNGGRLLVADFVDPEEVQAKIEGREPASPPKSSTPAVPPAPSSVQTPPARQQGRKQQVESEHPPTRHPAPPIAPPTKEKLPLPVADKNDPPITTLDDLFRKTKATPRIYYLPLTDEEVAKKAAVKGNTKQQRCK